MLEKSTTTNICYIVSASFLHTWFQDFVDLVPEDSVVYINEAEQINEMVFLKNLQSRYAPQDIKVVFFPGHQTLTRDCDLADLLATKGYTIMGVNRDAIMYGHNKLLMKQLLDRLGIDTPVWAPLTMINSPLTSSHFYGKEYIIKDCAGANGIGIFHSDDVPEFQRDNYYTETFVHGNEYSVIALSTTEGVVTFPPVWKGETRIDLLPPYKRLRVCPFIPLDFSLEVQMRKTTVELAHAINTSGFFEVEFVVTQGKQIMVFEINPRIAGTLLISAMATETKIFNLVRNGIESTALKPNCYVAEIPLVSCPANLPFINGVRFTSRLTVKGSTYRQIHEKLLHLIDLGVKVEREAMNTFQKEIVPLQSS